MNVFNDYTMKLYPQNTIDVITNSSSELFVLKSKSYVSVEESFSKMKENILADVIKSKLDGDMDAMEKQVSLAKSNLDYLKFLKENDIISLEPSKELLNDIWYELFSRHMMKRGLKEYYSSGTGVYHTKSALENVIASINPIFADKVYIGDVGTRAENPDNRFILFFNYEMYRSEDDIYDHEQRVQQEIRLMEDPVRRYIIENKYITFYRDCGKVFYATDYSEDIMYRLNARSFLPEYSDFELIDQEEFVCMIADKIEAEIIDIW